jgi:hypothetical protein
VYALVLAWCAALYFVIPKIRAGAGWKRQATAIPSQVGNAWRWAKKFLE